MPSAHARIISPFDALFTCLQESREVCVYEAVERLVRAAEAVGIDADALSRMLDQGLSLEELLELIQTRMESARNAA